MKETPTGELIAGLVVVLIIISIISGIITDFKIFSLF